MTNNLQLTFKDDYEVLVLYQLWYRASFHETIVNLGPTKSDAFRPDADSLHEAIDDGYIDILCCKAIKVDFESWPKLDLTEYSKHNESVDVPEILKYYVVVE